MGEGGEGGRPCRCCGKAEEAEPSVTTLPGTGPGTEHCPRSVPESRWARAEGRSQGICVSEFKSNKETYLLFLLVLNGRLLRTFDLLVERQCDSLLTFPFRASCCIPVLQQRLWETLLMSQKATRAKQIQGTSTWASRGAPPPLPGDSPSPGARHGHSAGLAPRGMCCLPSRHSISGRDKSNPCEMFPLYLT